MAHDVFISYSSRDKPAADGVCAALEQARIRCWMAPRDIAPGGDWSAAIMEAIGESRVLLLIFSGQANGSRHVQREVQHACDQGLAVVPFRLEDVAPTGGMRYYLGTVHWLDALSPPLERHHALLVHAVQALLSVVTDPADPAATAMPVPGEQAFVPPPARAVPRRQRTARRQQLWFGGIAVGGSALICAGLWALNRNGSTPSADRSTPAAPPTPALAPAATPGPTPDAGRLRAQAWLEKAWLEAQLLPHVILSDSVLSSLAIAQAGAGDADACRRTMAVLQHGNKSVADDFQATIWCALASAQARAGDAAGSRQTFAAAIQSGSALKGDDNKAAALRDIAAAQARAGDAAGSRQTFATAIQYAQAVETNYFKVVALSALASAQAGAGDAAGGRQTLAAALHTAQAAQDDFGRASALCAVAPVQAELGDATGCRRSLATALQCARTVTDEYSKFLALNAIAIAQAETGDTPAALQTIVGFSTEQSKTVALSAIASAQARAGDVAAALRTARTILDEYERVHALTDIAVTQSKAGDAAGSWDTMAAAIRDAQAITDNDVSKTRAFCVIVAAQARAGDFNAVEATLALLAPGEARCHGLIAAAEAVLENPSRPAGS